MRSTRAILTAGVATGLFALVAPTVAQTPPPAQRHFVPAGPGMARTIATDEPETIPHTLAQTLGLAYETNPQLTGERAHVRSTDENVPTALAGWRPTIAVTTSYGYAAGRFVSPGGIVAGGTTGSATSTGASTLGQDVATKNNRTELAAQATVTQYL